MKKRTLVSWNARGFRVKKGSKADSFNKKGIALFRRNQVYRYDAHDYEEGHGYTNEQGSYYFGGENPDQDDYDMGLCGQE